MPIVDRKEDGPFTCSPHLQARTMSLVILCLVFTLLATDLQAQVSSNRDTVQSTFLWRLVDLDSDGIQDTVYVTARTWKVNGIKQRERHRPSLIRWGQSRDTSQRARTDLDLPFPDDGGFSSSIYDINEDGADDLVMSWWWAQGEQGRTKERIIALLGGTAMRDSSAIRIARRSDVPDHPFVLRIDRSDSSRTWNASHGGIVLRERPSLPSVRPKMSPTEQSSQPASSLDLSAWPNPATNSVHLCLTGGAEGSESEVSIMLFSTDGRQEYNHVSSLKGLLAGLDVDVSAQSNGTYMVQVIQSNIVLASTTLIVRR